VKINAAFATFAVGDRNDPHAELSQFVQQCKVAPAELHSFEPMNEQTSRTQQLPTQLNAFANQATDFDAFIKRIASIDDEKED
jgi:hypothetical protein